MSRAPPQMRHLAEQLIAQENGEDQSSGAGAAFRACEKVRAHLATLMGMAGSRALLSRALAIATPQASWLKSVHIRPDGSLEERDQHETRSRSDRLAGDVALLAEMLGLLTAFIGEGLTLQMVRQLWPALKDVDSGKEHEQ